MHQQSLVNIECNAKS